MYQDLPISRSLDEFELWQITRRNSHPLADLPYLRKTRGGVLLNVADIGDFKYPEYATPNDLFEPTFTDISVGQEPTLEAELPVFSDDMVQAVQALPIKVTVMFIYPNGIRLQGDHHLEFKNVSRTPTTEDAADEYEKMLAQEDIEKNMLMGFYQ